MLNLFENFIKFTFTGLFYSIKCSYVLYVIRIYLYSIDRYILLKVDTNRSFSKAYYIVNDRIRHVIVSEINEDCEVN